MKVRMTIHRPLTDSSGRDIQAHPGLEIDLPADQAVRLVQSGQAEAVKVAAETATTESREQAVVPQPTTGRRKEKS